MNFQSYNDGAVLAELGRRLRARRLRANLTQDALARNGGVSVNTVRNAEDGHNVSLETLIRLLRALGELGQLDRVLDDSGPSPIELARRRGKPRERASGEDDGERDEWEW